MQSTGGGDGTYDEVIPVSTHSGFVPDRLAHLVADDRDLAPLVLIVYLTLHEVLVLLRLYGRERQLVSQPADKLRLLCTRSH